MNQHEDHILSHKVKTCLSFYNKVQCTKKYLHLNASGGGADPAAAVISSTRISISLHNCALLDQYVRTSKTNFNIWVVPLQSQKVSEECYIVHAFH